VNAQTMNTQTMNTRTIEECMAASFADTPFPKIVARLAGAGITSYTADLVKLRNTYYGADRESFDERCRCATGPRWRPRSRPRSIPLASPPR
jgi:uncharacterized protein YbcV (DUF1398 family)